MICQVTVKSSPLLRLTTDGKFWIAKTDTEPFINAELVTVCEEPPVYEKVVAMSICVPVPDPAAVTASVIAVDENFSKLPTSLGVKPEVPKLAVAESSGNAVSLSTISSKSVTASSQVPCPKRWFAVQPLALAVMILSVCM